MMKFLKTVITGDWKKKTLLFGLFILTFSNIYAQSATTSYIKKYRSLASSMSAKYGIPVSIILGIAIVESSSGTSLSCKRLKNHFGMRGKNGLRKSHNIRTGFKQYHSAAASYLDFCMMMKRRKYYAALKGVKHYQPWLKAISKAGYSTHPVEWTRRITGVIVKHKL